VCCIRVIVDTTKEGGSGIGTNSSLDEVSSSGVFLSKGAAVMDEAVDDHQWSVLGLLLKVLPRHDREIIVRHGPLEVLGRLGNLLELHRVLALLDLVRRERLEVRGEAKVRHGKDEPLGRVVLVPLDGVPVVLGELVVEVVVTFTDRDEGSHKVITRRVLVVKGSVTEPMSERVDAEGRVVNEAESSSTGK